MSVTLFEIIYSTIIGLIIGSFLNVIILYIPKKMFCEWKNEACDFLIDDLNENIQKNLSKKQKANSSNSLLSQTIHFLKQTKQNNTLAKPKNIISRRSRCPTCNYKIAWYDNLPLLSWFILKGKCRHCEKPISKQYPIIEFITGMLFCLSVIYWGFSLETLIILTFFCFIICIGTIDFNTQYIPDFMVYVLIWFGILLSLTPYSFVTTSESILGTIIGYLILWSVYWLFKLATGKDGMGYGDFKLLAAIGAFWGYYAIIPVLFISTVVGSIIGITLLIKNKKSMPFAFGPFLSIAVIFYVFFQKDILLFLNF